MSHIFYRSSSLAPSALSPHHINWNWQNSWCSVLFNCWVCPDKRSRRLPIDCNCADKWFHTLHLIGITGTIDFGWFTWSGLTCRGNRWKTIHYYLVGFFLAINYWFRKRSTILNRNYHDYRVSEGSDVWKLAGTCRTTTAVQLIWSVHNNTMLVLPLHHLDRELPCLPNHLQGALLCLVTSSINSMGRVYHNTISRYAVMSFITQLIAWTASEMNCADNSNYFK